MEWVSKMNFSKGIFRAYDIRGVVGKDFDINFAFHLGRAFVDFLKCKTVVVGRDARVTSNEIFNELVRGINNAGADVIDLGECTTPMFYYTVANESYDSGIMITASHNPAEYNGFKLTREEGIPIGLSSGGSEIRDLIGQDYSSNSKGTVEKYDVTDEYVEHCLKSITKIKEFKVVVDVGNGMAGFLVKKIFDALPCELIEMYFDVDMSFPNHEANPALPENLVDLKNKVLETGAELGLAFDGDGDRIFLLTEKGEVLSGDFTTALIAKTLLAKDSGKAVVYDLRSSWATKEMIEKSGGIPKESRVGYAFIKKLMRETDAIFAGELSGHFYYKYNFYHESAIITALKIMELMCSTNKSLSELLKPLKTYFQSGEINKSVENRELALAKIEEEFKDFSISRLDGIKVETEDYWFNLRPSNTEPVVRFTAEAKTQEKLDEITNKVLSLI